MYISPSSTEAALQGITMYLGIIEKIGFIRNTNNIGKGITDPFLGV